MAYPKFWRSAPYARPLAGFIRSGGEGEREGRGEEQKGTSGAGRTKSGRKVWNRAAD